MKVKLYLYPAYVDLPATQLQSEILYGMLRDRGVEFQEDHWDGTVESLPAGEAVMIRMSSTIRAFWEEIVQRCAELGHLCFYNETVLTPSGEIDSRKAIVPLIDEFLARARERQMPKELVIPYLWSVSADDTTLGTGEHLRRKAEMLLPLFEEHVLPSQAASDPDLDVFASAYPVVRSGIDLGEGEGPSLGLDMEAIRGLRAQIESDAMLLADMGLVPLSNDPRARRYLRKLSQGVQGNLTILTDAAIATRNMYQSHDNPILRHLLAARFQENADYIMATGGARHNIRSAVMALEILFGILLPIVTMKLVSAGYPDSTEIIEWDYTKPLPLVAK